MNVIGGENFRQITGENSTRRCVKWCLWICKIFMWL